MGSIMPRFSLRMLFVAVAVVAVAVISLSMSWVAWQLNWIRQRHVFLAQHCSTEDDDSSRDRWDDRLPWQLEMFGETERWKLYVPAEYQKRTMELFPEAIVNPPRKNFQD